MSNIKKILKSNHYLNPKLTFAVLGILLLAVGGFFVYLRHIFRGLPEVTDIRSSQQKKEHEAIEQLIEKSNYCNKNTDCVYYYHPIYYGGKTNYGFAGSINKAEQAPIQKQVDAFFKKHDVHGWRYPEDKDPMQLKCKNNKCVDVRIEKLPSEVSFPLGENQEILAEGILLEFGPRSVSTSKGLFYATIAHICKIEDQLLLKKVEITDRGGKVIKSFDVDREIETIRKEMQELNLLIEQDKNKLRALGATEEELQQWNPSDPAIGVLAVPLSEKIRKNSFSTGYFEVDLSKLKEPLEWGDKIPFIINIYLVHNNYPQDFVKEVLVEYQRRNLPTEEISVTTDKIEYEQGETVKITVKKNLDIPIWYAKVAQCGADFWLLQDCQDKDIPYYTPCEWADYSHHFTPLPSSEILAGRWSGLILDENYELKIANTGCYKIVFPYSLNEKQALGQGWEDDILKIDSPKFFIREEELTREEELKSCAANSECIKIKPICCGDNTGGTFVSINKNHLDYWNQKINALDCSKEENICDIATPCLDQSCLMDPECIKGVCELTKQHPYTVTPACGVSTTDRLISFGWFPVDYESKHIIQIDNNPDFSSPEIEKYETSSGVFTPKTLLNNGTYFWRVKSTKVEKEKCLAPPCDPNLNDPNDPCSKAIKGYKECKKQYSNWSDACQFTIKVDDLGLARSVLIEYFSLLNEGKYTEAVKYHGSGYDYMNTAIGYETKLDSSNPAHYPELLKRGCGFLVCENVNVIKEEKISADEFMFTVQFVNEDGSLVKSYPYCCGEEPPPGVANTPKTEFEYKVKKAGDEFLVITRLFYVP